VDSNARQGEYYPFYRVLLRYRYRLFAGMKLLSQSMPADIHGFMKKMQSKKNGDKLSLLPQRRHFYLVSAEEIFAHII
jgi:hypothetical protein